MSRLTSYQLARSAGSPPLKRTTQVWLFRIVAPKELCTLTYDRTVYAVPDLDTFLSISSDGKPAEAGDFSRPPTKLWQWIAAMVLSSPFEPFF